MASLFALAGGGSALAASTSSGEKAQTAIGSVEAKPEAAQIAKQQLDEARDALDRAKGARQANDAPHAQLLDSLALEWAETAVDLARTAELEKQAAALEEETAEIEGRAKRALALIEQTVARRGRARQRLQELGVEVPEEKPAATAPAPATGEKVPAPEGAQ